MKPVLWLFGLPSSGKTTLSRALRDHLQAEGRHVILLDGDELRSGLCADLGFSDADRSENLRRAAHLAKLAAAQGTVVICAFVTPKEHHRALVRRILGTALHLIHIDCPLEVCISRDVKSLYAKASARQMSGMTGTQDDFDPPAKSDAVVSTHELPLADSVRRLIETFAQLENTPAQN